MVQNTQIDLYSVAVYVLYRLLHHGRTACPHGGVNQSIKLVYQHCTL